MSARRKAAGAELKANKYCCCRPPFKDILVPYVQQNEDTPRIKDDIPILGAFLKRNQEIRGEEPLHSSSGDIFFLNTEPRRMKRMQTRPPNKALLRQI